MSMVPTSSDWETAAEKLQVKLRAAVAVLREREAELLELKGPCRTEGCPLHYAHRGPCLLEGRRS